jgi:DNA gyrase subunit A
MSLIIELKRGAQPRTVLNQLHKYTPLQSTFGAQMLALVDGQPRLLSLKRALQIYIAHRHEVITRRSQFDLDKARARAHILEGLRIALANLDAVIQTIRESPTADEARTA